MRERCFDELTWFVFVELFADIVSNHTCQDGNDERVKNAGFLNICRLKLIKTAFGKIEGKGI